jgi:hypothetical protein
MARDESGGELSHLDEHIATQFAQLGWRPSEREAPVDEGPTAPTGSELANLLVDLVVRIDRMERHLSDRDEAMVVAIDKSLTELGDRMWAAERALLPAVTAADAAAAALQSTCEELRRADRPLQQVGSALEGVQKAMRAQLRVLAALQETAGGGDAGDVVAQLTALREQGEMLAARVEEVERSVAYAADEAASSSVTVGGPGEPSGDAGPVGGHLGDEVVEAQGGDVDRGDERMF